MITRIGFIRHGCTEWNTERRAQGQTDIPLNELGVFQAEALAKELFTKKQWEYIFSSDLTRAIQTAEIIGRKLEKEIIKDARLREMYKGDIEGTTLEERINRWGLEWEQKQEQLGIESEESIFQRGISVIHEITKNFQGKSVLVVSHGALIETIVQRLITSLNFQGPLKNTSLTVISHINTLWECEKINCINHLEGISKGDGSF